MQKTLSLNRRTHLFVRGDALYIKLQRPHNLDPMKADFYIIKKFNIKRLREIRDWADTIIKEHEALNNE